MSHISDRQLVESYYGEEESAALRAHLSSCPECQARHASLLSALDAIELPPPDEPGDAFEQRAWSKLNAAMDHEPGPVRPGWAVWRALRRGPFNWRVAAAMAAMLVAGFFAGRLHPAPERATVPPLANAERQQVRLAALSDHLESSEILLTELLNTSDGQETDISYEQRRAGELLPNNRLLREAALIDGDLVAVTILEDLERTLLDIVHEPSTLNAVEMDVLRQRVASGETLFRVRLLGRQLRASDVLGGDFAASGRG